MRVLVVEDERKVAGFLRAGLEEQGFVVEVSHHGDEAWRDCRRSRGMRRCWM